MLGPGAPGRSLLKAITSRPGVNLGTTGETGPVHTLLAVLALAADIDRLAALVRFDPPIAEDSTHPFMGGRGVGRTTEAALDCPVEGGKIRTSAVRLGTAPRSKGITPRSIVTTGRLPSGDRLSRRSERTRGEERVE